jgi:hypothetical protein
VLQRHTESGGPKPDLPDREAVPLG